VFHLRGNCAGQRALFVDLRLNSHPSGEINIEVYVAVSDRRVALIKLYEPPPADMPDSDDTTWRSIFLNYNQDVTITPPR